MIGAGADHLNLDVVLGITLRSNISNERGMVEQGLTLLIAGLWNIECACKVPTSVNDGPTVVST